MTHDWRALYRELRDDEQRLLRAAFQGDLADAQARFDGALRNTGVWRDARATMRFCEERLAYLNELLGEEHG